MMDVDVMLQQARVMRETYQTYCALLEEKKKQIAQGMLDQKLEQQLEQTQAYLLQLTGIIQKGIDEEREYVYG
jgi:Rod binding domain-containing protein